MSKNIELQDHILITKDSTAQLKGIAILLVVFSHLILIKFFDIDGFAYTGGYGVAIFLILSGYGLAYSYKRDSTLMNYFYKRVSKVLLPYSLVTIAWILIDIIIFNKVYSLKLILAAILGLDVTRSIDPSMWYVTFIILWYIAFYAIFKLPLRNVVKIFVLFCLSYTFDNLVINRFPALFWQFDLHAYAFPVGVIISLYSSKIIKLININAKLILTLLFILFVILFALLYPITSHNLYYYSSSNIALTLSIILLVITLNLYNLKSKTLIMLGNISYELYLFEFVFLTKYPILGFFKSKLIAIIVYLTVIVLLSIMLKRLISYLIKWNKEGLEAQMN